MELKWQLLDPHRVKLRINAEPLAAVEVDALIVALQKVRAKMRPRLRASAQDVSVRDASVCDVSIRDASSTTPSYRGGEALPATLPDALDAIASLLAQSPEDRQPGVAALLKTFARIGEISNHGLAMLLTSPAANEGLAHTTTSTSALHADVEMRLENQMQVFGGGR